MSRLQLMLFLSLVVPPGAALAQDAAKEELAKRHYNLGEQLYRTSDYAGALVEFKKSHQLSGRPELLFNIARCHEVLAQLEEAVAAYERYLKERPDAPNADLVTSRLATLRKRLEVKRREDSEAEKKRRAEKEQRRRAGAERHEDRRQQPAERPSRWKRTAGWVTLGVGAAALCTGVIFGVMARGKAAEFEDGVAEGKLYYELDEIDSQGKRFNNVALATLIVGGVGVAAGGGMLIWDWISTRGERRSARLLPFASGGLAAHFSF
jgi:tetratricopeptide (TPR) repeat protein